MASSHGEPLSHDRRLMPEQSQGNPEGCPEGGACDLFGPRFPFLHLASNLNPKFRCWRVESKPFRIGGCTREIRIKIRIKIRRGYPKKSYSPRSRPQRICGSWRTRLLPGKCNDFRHSAARLHACLAKMRGMGPALVGCSGLGVAEDLICKEQIICHIAMRA